MSLMIACTLRRPDGWSVLLARGRHLSGEYPFSQLQVQNSIAAMLSSKTSCPCDHMNVSLSYNRTKPNPRTSPLHLAPLLGPVQPAARVLAHPGPSRVLGQPRRGAASHAGLAVEYDLLVLGRPRVPETVLEVLLGDVEAVGLRRHGDVDRARHAAGRLELAWLPDICGGSGAWVSWACSLSFSPLFLVRLCVCMETIREEGQSIFGLKGTEGRGSCRTDYYNVGFRVLGEFLDLCTGNCNSSAILSVCLFMLPSFPPPVPVCRSLSIVARVGRVGRKGVEGPMRNVHPQNSISCSPRAAAGSTCGCQRERLLRRVAGQGPTA